jgi:hypothetical protein
VVGAAERVDRVDDAGLVRDHLLRPQGKSDGVLGGQGERLVVRVGVQRLRAAENRRQCFDRRPRYIHQWLLPRK